MNIISIDPSLTCTAMVINGRRFVFASHDLAHTKKGALTKWFKECENLVHYEFIDYEKTEGYSNNEVAKLIAYQKTIERIIILIYNSLLIDFKQPVKILIEGYSYSSQAGPLIDLVTFSTLLRNAIINLPLADVTIYAPTQLKLEAAKLTYEPIKKGKKVIKYEYRNHEGVAGGQFTKFDMLKALTQCDKYANSWVYFLKTHQAEILNYKSVPKPIEDVNDAMLLYYIGLETL